MTDHVIPYGPKWTTAFVGLLFAAIIAVSLCRLAFLPEELAEIAFLEPFGATGAMIIMMVGAASFAALAVASAYLLVVAVTRRRVIVLREGAMLFPHGILRSRSSRIPYQTIRSIKIERLGTKRALRIRATNATLLIVESMLPSAAHLKLIARELSSRSATGRAGEK